MVAFASAVTPPTVPAGRSAWFLGGNEGLAVVAEGERARLPTAEEARAAGATPESAHYLGRLGDDLDCFAFGPDRGVTLPAPMEIRPLRMLWGALDEQLWPVAGRAIQIIEWDRTHRFCGRCGHATERSTTERVRRCPACTLSAYPRVAPAVIVLVERGDEILLARAGNFPAAFYSTLAGFVEAGESLEETVAREIEEEVGIRVEGLRYFGSQSWPFPNSLMVGFRARWAGGELHIDGKEIIDAGWYRAGALPRIPPRLSIARALIDAWLAEQPGTVPPGGSSPGRAAGGP